MNITDWVIFFGVITFVGSVIIAPGLHAYIAYYLAPGRLLNKILFDQGYRSKLIDSLIMGMMEDRKTANDGKIYKAIDVLIDRAMANLSKGIPSIAKAAEKIQEEIGQDLTPGQAIVLGLMPKDMKKAALSILARNKTPGEKKGPTGNSNSSPFGD